MSTIRRAAEEVQAAAEALVEESHEHGQQAGAFLALSWVEYQIQSRLGAAEKYDDTRPLSDLLLAVQDKMRETLG